VPAMRSPPAPLAPAHIGGSAHAGLGLAVAATIGAAWVITLVMAVGGSWPLWLVPLIIALRTFLSTGLFITAHDAMHGLVTPGWPRLNHAVGALAVFLYAGFGFRGLLEAHHVHHAAPGTAADPDFHRGDSRLLPWFVSFMRRYVTLGQLLVVTAFFQICIHLLGIPVGTMLLYWALPALLSAVQLWYFGTWRPHHPRPEGFADEHRAVGERWPAWATFLSCYHFGLHHTHHLAPWVPWWRLPGADRALFDAGDRELDVVGIVAGAGGVEEVRTSAHRITPVGRVDQGLVGSDDHTESRAVPHGVAVEGAGDLQAERRISGAVD